MLNKTFICADCSDSFKEGWATILKDNQLYTYCCYSCYQSNPIIVPTKSKFKSSDEKVVLPTIIDTDDSFEFLSETEINQLTNDEYKSYKEDGVELEGKEKLRYSIQKSISLSDEIRLQIDQIFEEEQVPTYIDADQAI